jgi:hypothetical protein
MGTGNEAAASLAGHGKEKAAAAQGMSGDAALVIERVDAGVDW